MPLSTAHATLLLALTVTTLLPWTVHGAIEHGAWDYADKGPATWAKAFPQFCDGRKQSPIALSVAGSQLDVTLREFSIRIDETPDYKLVLTNDGNKAVLNNLGSGGLVIRMGQGDNMYYTAAQLHWHWGSDDQQGSEHTMDGRTYPMEGHLVFFNSHDYANFSIAVHRVSGLAVLGVFFELSDTDNPLLKELEPLLPQIVNFSSQATANFSASKLNLVDAFLPKTRRHFYRYEGGLTTPTCNENVLWTVFRDTVPISRRQLALMRSLRYPNGKPLVNNYRPPQPLNSAHTPGANRQLYRSFSRRGQAFGDPGFDSMSMRIPAGETCGAVRPTAVFVPLFSAIIAFLPLCSLIFIYG